MTFGLQSLKTLPWLIDITRLSVISLAALLMISFALWLNLEYDDFALPVGFVVSLKLLRSLKKSACLALALYCARYCVKIYMPFFNYHHEHCDFLYDQIIFRPADLGREI